MGKVQIIGAPQSSFVRTVRMVAEEKAIAYDLVAVGPHSPEIDAVHPLGKIPVMRHGEVTLFESKAIATYLDRVFPGPRMIPDEPIGCAKVEQWVSLINTNFGSVFGPYVGAYFFSKTPDGSLDRAAIDAVLAKVQTHLTLFDRAIAASGNLAGADFSLADIYLLPILHYLNALPESGAMIAQAPALASYFARHGARASVKATIPPPLPKRAAA